MSRMTWHTTTRACLGLSIILGLGAVLLGAVLGAQQGQSRQVEWPAYGGDPAGSKYSPTDDITPQNVQRLAVAWQWEHGEKPLEEYGTVPFRFENQPLMVDGVLYVTTPYNNAAALDKNTGRELWRAKLPYVNVENTMTYRTRAGRQFVLASTGAGPDASLVAFALEAR